MEKIIKNRFNSLLDGVDTTDKVQAAKQYKEIFKAWIETNTMLEEAKLSPYEDKTAEEIKAIKWNGELPKSITSSGCNAQLSIFGDVIGKSGRY